MGQFEYFILKGALMMKGNVQRMEDDLNRLGAEGWEAVSMTGEPNKNVYVVMKRQK
jgi:hypothetical protein